MEKLVKKAKKGDNEAFSKLITMVQKDLYKIARMRFSSLDDINDVVQETIIHAYSSISSLKNPKYFKSWIIRILINECNRLYSSNSNSNLELQEDYYSLSNDEIEGRINELDFESLINHLNYEERLIITLFYMENLKSKEIASILNTKDSTVKVKLMRARKKLEKYAKGGIYE